MKVKVFLFQTKWKAQSRWEWSVRPNVVPTNERDVEKSINDWLAENPDIKVIHVEQSLTGGSLGNRPYALVSIWYERAP